MTKITQNTHTHKKKNNNKTIAGKHINNYKHKPNKSESAQKKKLESNKQTSKTVKKQTKQ